MVFVKICPVCGSEEFGFEGTLCWSVDSQEWEVDSIYDGQGFCGACEAQDIEPLTCESDVKDHYFAAYKAGWRCGGENGSVWYDGRHFERWVDAVGSSDAVTYGSAREVCDGEGLVVDGAK